MAIRDIFKVSRKTFVNPSAWIDMDFLRDQNQMMWSVLKNLFSKPGPIEKETFDQAMKRLNLNEQDIQRSTSYYQGVAMLFALLGLTLFFYAFYLVFKHVSFTGWLLAFASGSLFFAKAFQYDFWAFQLERRTLGLTFADWKAKYLGK